MIRLSTLYSLTEHETQTEDLIMRMKGENTCKNLKQNKTNKQQAAEDVWRETIRLQKDLQASRNRQAPVNTRGQGRPTQHAQPHDQPQESRLGGVPARVCPRTASRDHRLSQSIFLEADWKIQVFIKVLANGYFLNTKLRKHMGGGNPSGSIKKKQIPPTNLELE